MAINDPFLTHKIKRYLKQSLIASLALLFPIVLGNITCETSDASPDTSDVTDSINALKGMGSDCPQSNNKDSHCTTWASVGSSAVAFCGDFNTDMQCATMRQHALDIQNACLSNGKVGGTAHLPNDVRVEVIHS